MQVSLKNCNKKHSIAQITHAKIHHLLVNLITSLLASIATKLQMNIYTITDKVSKVIFVELCIRKLKYITIQIVLNESTTEKYPSILLWVCPDLITYIKLNIIKLRISDDRFCVK